MTTPRTKNPLKPEFAIFWHPTLNGDETSDKYSNSSGFKPWWQCKLKHDFKAAIRDFTNGHGCPYCAGNKAWAGYNDLATLRPEMAAQWHSTLNGILPTQVTVASKIKVWWTGECGHDFFAAVGARTVSGTACPYCAGQKILIGFNDLATTHPDIVKQWHPTKNTEYTPQSITSGTNKKVWWIGECGHEFFISVSEKTRVGTSLGCAYCSGKKVLAGFNDLASNHPEIAAEWSPTNKLKADEVSAKSTVKYEWICPEKHIFVKSVRTRTNDGVNCSYCAGKEILVGHNDLGTTHPYLIKEWNEEKNGDLTIGMFSKSSNTKVWWNCLVNKDHIYFSSPQSRTDKRTESGCNICSNRMLSVGHNDLATVYPEIVLQWHPTKNGDLKVTDVMRSYCEKVFWLCDKGHEWEVSPLSRIANRNGEIYISNCPICQAKTFSSKAEKEIVAILESLGEEMILNGRKFLEGIELDIYLPKKGIAIEYNGLYWHSIDKNGQYKNYHYDKWLACKERGVQLIQIWEDDWMDKPDVVMRSILHKIGVTNKSLESITSLDIELKEKIYARKTTISRINLFETREFFAKNHIQGFASGSHYLGLRDTNNDVVAMMTLKKEKDNTLNIIRYATDRTVVGGFTKILKYAERNLPVERFITFSDHCISDGSLYANNGFIADKELKPDYMYVVGKYRKHKFGYRINKFRTSPTLKWEEGMTESQLATLNKLQRIYDAGKTRWVKNVYRE